MGLKAAVRKARFASVVVAEVELDAFGQGGGTSAGGRMARTDMSFMREVVSSQR
jgi:hypothetical protein